MKRGFGRRRTGSRQEGFSKAVTEAVKNHPGISVYNEEITSLPGDGITVIATGPLTSDAFAAEIMRITGRDSLYFYDAAAPIVTYESIDMTKAFRASRYGKGRMTISTVRWTGNGTKCSGTSL